jgi:heat shock protein HslJ
MSRSLILPTLAALVLNPLVALACEAPVPPRFGGDPGTGISVSVGRIADVNWVPLVIDGEAVPEGSGLWLKIASNGAVQGSTGCNRFTGTTEIDAGALVLNPLAVTEMACADPARMEREAAFLKTLGEVRWFVVSPEGLWLTREDGSVAVCLG